MVRGSDREDDPDLATIFTTLADPTCRKIIEALEEPMDAKDVADSADIPVSTTYKKLDKLQESGLVRKETQLDPGGHHRARFLCNFDRVVVEQDDDQSLTVAIEESMEKPEKQLVDLWTSIREQT